MDEQTWLACAEPFQMLEFLKDKATDRKVQFWVCACVRQIPELLHFEPWRNAIHETEDCAENPPDWWSNETLSDNDILLPLFDLIDNQEPFIPRWVVTPTANPPNEQEMVWVLWNSKFHKCLSIFRNGQSFAPPRAAVIAMTVAVWSVAKRGLQGSSSSAEIALENEEKGQSFLFRDIFGNPFRPIALDPSWLTPTVQSLAQAAYNEPILPAGTLDNNRLAILADALTDASCTDQAILDHLRCPSLHVRGCHALDLLLAKG